MRGENMSGKTEHVYEIHTSMKEELVLDELRAMKRKFLPAGRLTAKQFHLMVLAPAQQNGRRRAGGFVQLAGSISQKGDMNCINIKTCSGVSFIIPMFLVVFLSCTMGVVFLAEKWKTVFLFPAVFLLVFFSVLLYMRKKGGREAEKILREHFEGTDRATEFCYTTHYTKEECMEFMAHDNMNDIYRYEWRQEKSFGALIIKDYKKPNHIQDFDGRQEWGFIVRFYEQPGENTRIETQLVQTEKLPYIHNKTKIDMFWENKLGAIAK